MRDLTKTIQTSTRPALRQGVRVRRDPVTDNQILLYPDGFKALSGTAADVLRLCNGRRTVTNITNELLDEYDGVDEKAIMEDVVSFLNKLYSEHLLANVA